MYIKLTYLMSKKGCESISILKRGIAQVLQNGNISHNPSIIHVVVFAYSPVTLPSLLEEVRASNSVFIIVSGYYVTHLNVILVNIDSIISGNIREIVHRKYVLLYCAYSFTNPRRHIKYFSIFRLEVVVQERSVISNKFSFPSNIRFSHGGK